MKDKLTKWAVHLTGRIDRYERKAHRALRMHQQAKDRVKDAYDQLCTTVHRLLTEAKVLKGAVLQRRNFSETELVYEAGGRSSGANSYHRGEERIFLGGAKRHEISLEEGNDRIEMLMKMKMNYRR